MIWLLNDKTHNEWIFGVILSNIAIKNCNLSRSYPTVSNRNFRLLIGLYKNWWNPYYFLINNTKNNPKYYLTLIIVKSSIYLCYWIMLSNIV